MTVLRGLNPGTLSSCVVTLGMFDGIHRGHQALLHGCRRVADRLGQPAVALTYDPHPSRILRPEMPVHLLTPLPEKLTRLQQGPIDHVVLVEFTRAFSLLSADEYLDQLVAALNPRAIVVGYRTTFGRGREGNAQVLQAYGTQHGIAVEIVEPVEVRGIPVSSTQVRSALNRGEVGLAAELLGYRYRMEGMVVEGDHRGAQLGVPTANLAPPEEKLIPADGVYAVNASTCDATRRAVMSIGTRPTFNRPHALEVHLLDFAGNLYDQVLTVTFLERLRGICTYPSADALMTQMREDISRARAL